MRGLQSLFTGAIALLVQLATCAASHVEDISESSYDILAIDTVNSQKLRPLLADIVTNTDFFKYYRLDLYGRPCPFWSDEGMCGNRACAVDTIDDEDHLPEIWRSEYLGRLSAGSTIESDDLDDALGDEAEESCVRDNDLHAPVLPQSRPMDYCTPEDVSGDGPGVYVSLVNNPERYTGYVGPHANKVWEAIYTENCFPDNSQWSYVSQPSHQFTSAVGRPLGQALMEGNKQRIREGGERGRHALNSENTCIEKKVFYKLISGMHASISTHLCNEFLDTETGEWGPNLDLFMEKVGNFPDRIANVYFNYGLVAKAVAKLRHYLEDFTFCTNAQGYDADTRRKMLRIAVEADRSVPNHFDAKGMFRDQPELKEEFRSRFVNVSRIMDCTGCDKCRLWGKLQVTGYATALKILFELPDDCTGQNIQLQRMEMVALINTFDRLSKSVSSISMFLKMLAHPESIPTEEPRISEQDSESKQDSKNKSYQRAWDDEWYSAWEAVKFILKSYVDFPKNLWRLILHYADKQWTKFVGRDAYIEKEQYDRYMRMQNGKDEL
ncbi:endoplasmic reticulum Oxidoreductin 1-domain-containing protein [Lipomyces orientalis]|uniref:Endoplasmic reticulum Oxidoreductin 1-domain-containing protein n=1 Tax=Lipomyces orientalis TaxID=1233043 RepID=A0ACC3TQN0_9ASCO